MGCTLKDACIYAVYHISCEPEQHSDKDSCKWIDVNKILQYELKLSMIFLSGVTTLMLWLIMRRELQVIIR
jgi:hypothetical protein